MTPKFLESLGGHMHSHKLLLVIFRFGVCNPFSTVSPRYSRVRAFNSLLFQWFKIAFTLHEELPGSERGSGQREALSNNEETSSHNHPQQHLTHNV